MARPTVSVVLTTYNRAQVLGETLRGLLGQTFRDFELLVCDDASEDGTGEVVREFARCDPRVSYLGTGSHLGMPGNLNRGIRAAVGEYIANLHDGDIYAPTLLESWKAILDRYPSAGFVFNAYAHLDARGCVRRVQRMPFDSGLVPGRRLLEDFFFRSWRFWSPVWGTAMVRRQVYDDVGLLDPRYGFLADVDLWMRIAERWDVGYVDEVLIQLPSRRTLPRQVRSAWFKELSSLWAMFWRARVRHFRGRPCRLATEALRHCVYMVESFGFWALAAAARRLYYSLLVR